MLSHAFPCSPIHLALLSPPITSHDLPHDHGRLSLPQLFHVLWKMVKPLLDPASAAKYTVLGPVGSEDVQNALLEAGVDPDFLAKEVASSINQAGSPA